MCETLTSVLIYIESYISIDCILLLSLAKYKTLKLQFWKNVQGRSCHSAANQKVSKSSSRVGAVEESNSSGACDFTGENTFRCEVLYFPVYCVRPCIASYVIRMPVAKLGLAPPAFCETLPLCNGRDPVFCEALPFCETLCEILPSVRPWLLWGLAFCGTLASVRLCLLWGPSFCETLT